MKRALAMLALLVCLLGGSAAAQGSAWSDLWLTQDQQGQRLLDTGQPAAAARKFTDARRRAYAEIQAGNYADAARRLEPFNDPQSQYNRGNALARSGELVAALAAYGQAIDQTDTDSQLGRDARHNRDLLAAQLAKQQLLREDFKGRAQPSKQTELRRGERNGAGGSGQAHDSPSAQSQQHQALVPELQSEPRADGAKQEVADANRQDTTAEGRRETAVSRPPEDAANQPANPPAGSTLELEQWLQRVPEDPAGLLRRKFAIEHRRKQESRR